MSKSTFLSLIIAIDRDIETKPNEVYGLVSGQTNEHHDREFCEPLIMYMFVHIVMTVALFQYYKPHAQAMHGLM